MRWDDDEKKIPFKGKIVCPTALFENVVVATLEWKRLWSCLIENFGALLTTCQEVGVIRHPTLLKFLGDVMSVKLRRQGVASNPTHVILLLFRSIPSHPL